MAGAQGDRTREGKLSLAAAVCKQIVELRRQDKHPNNGGRQNMETGDAAKSSNVGDLQDEGCVPGRGLRALGMSRRRKLPRSSMKRLYPRARRLAWSSKHGLPGLGENVWDSRAFRAKGWAWGRGPQKGGLLQSLRESPSRTLFRASGRKLEKFTVSVNVAAGSKVTFELTYEELLKAESQRKSVSGGISCAYGRRW